MKDKYLAIIEALLFTARKPVAIENISGTLDITIKETKDYLDQLAERYHNKFHGIILKKYDNKYIITSKAEFSSYIKKLHNLNEEVSLSSAALETLTIIAYRQPVTRIEIEEIRGVKAEKTLLTLSKYNLIKELGRKNTIGNPIVYGTTDKFLQYFDLEDLSQLPEIEEITE